MKHLIPTLILCGLLTGALVTVNKVAQRPSTGILIGILQTAPHPALDAVRTAFMSSLRAALGTRVSFIEHTGQGNIASLQAAADSMAHNPAINGFLTIGTAATQALTAREHERPVIFSAVTLPAQCTPPAWLTANVSGVSDDVDIPTQLDVVRQLVPDAQTVGLLFTTSEQNSRMAVDLLEQACLERGLTPIKIGVLQETDLPAALQKHLAQCDVLIAPTDNTVACTLDLILREFQRTPKPLILSDHLLLRRGVAASCGADFTENGVQAAELMQEALTSGKDLSGGRVLHHTSTVQFHAATLEDLGISLVTSVPVP